MYERTKLLQQIEELTIENNRLKNILAKNAIDYKNSIARSPSYNRQDSDRSIVSNKKLQLFKSMFNGRQDVYSKRSARPDYKTGKYNYYVQKDYSSPEKKNLPLTDKALIDHLKGTKPDCSDVIGVYPMLKNETCNFLVFDFDNHDDGNGEKLKTEVASLRELCQKHNIGHLIERSRSGRGYHIWFFFETAIPANIARQFGTTLLIKSAESVSQTDFQTFDRMIPASDYLPINRKTGEKGIGNMVALPLQGQALKHGNSAFIDEKWEPYKDQWATLKSTPKLDAAIVEHIIADWGTIRISDGNEDDAPWEPKNSIFHAEDVNGTIDITLADKIYIDKNYLRPCIQNQLRRLAAFNNPEFYKKTSNGVFGLWYPQDNIFRRGY